MNIKDYILNSFNTAPGGASGRKLTAFALTGCVVSLHLIYFYYLLKVRNFSLFTSVLIIDLVAIGFFMGLVTAQNIVQFKNGGIIKESSKIESTTVQTETTTK